MDAPLSEADVLAVTLWAEARGEPIEGKAAVASVIRNRVASGRWGHSYDSVCRAPWQFSCWNDGTDANHLRLLEIVGQIQGGQPVKSPSWPECRWVAEGCLSGAMKDRSNGALHYHAASMLPRPKWAQGKLPCADAGAHLFYCGIA